VTPPRLRRGLVVVEQVYRGESSYIVKDPESYKYFRFRPVEVVVMQEFDGEHTTAQVATALAAQGLPFGPAAVEAFAAKLRQLGLVERSLAERSVLLMERVRAERRRRLRSARAHSSLLRMRWALADPDQWLERWLPRLRVCFSRPFLVASVGLFAAYALVAWTKWPELAHALAALTTPASYTVELFLVFWTTAMVVIVVHELGHAFTCKYFGGQVHEMGAMLIYFQPAFYCNVNDAWTFRDRAARLWVTAAGSWIQLVLAGLAAIVWWAAEPETLISQIALAAMVIGGVTTVLANANPLIPLDGYYALSDYLEIPNLRTRAFAYVGWLVRRYGLRLAVPPPPADPHERRAFLIYGTLALLYSVTILTLLAGAAFGWASRALGTIGVLALALVLWGALRSKLQGLGRALVTSIREHGALWRSRRFWSRAGGTAALVAIGGLLVPWPITVQGAFTARPLLELAVSAPEGGVLAQVFVREGERVPPGARLALIRSFPLERRAAVLQRIVDSLTATAAQARARGPTAEVRRREAARGAWTAEQDGLERRLAALALRAPVAGVVATARLEERLGRSMSAGEEVVRLLEPDSVELVVALERAGATLVRSGQVAALFARVGAGHSLQAHVTSVRAAATEQGLVEARIRVATRAAGLRPGVTGEAKIVVRQSNVWGALAWAVRKRIRSDLLL